MKPKPQKLTNGNTVYPPPKGKSVGEWVESGRTRTQIVRFIRERNEYLLAWFFDDVDWVRLHADGTIEMDSSLEKVPGSLDVRNHATPDNAASLIQIGGEAARALRLEFDRQRQQTKDTPLDPEKPKKKKAVKR